MFVTGTVQHAASSRKTIREEKYQSLNKAIRAVIKVSTIPLTAEEILSYLQGIQVAVSITTVYNRLRKMVTQGAVDKRKNAAGSFEYTNGPIEK